MKLTNHTIKDLFSNDAKMTFLIGAGCSVDAPSCLPAGHPMMEAIINYTCAECEKEKILKLKELRFEQLVEIIRDRLDPELKIIDYYGQCASPNLLHFFLAEMIKKGHFVITTNFDFLIEYAMMEMGVPKEEIVPILTKQDFETYSNPNFLVNEGKKPIYKIHGSTKNVITGENTEKSLVATIQAFGSNKKGLNVFYIEPFKQPLFENVSNGRSLVIMGYSGSDDFDIIPTIKVLKNLQNIIWINHKNEDDGKEKIYRIDIYNNSSKEFEKVNQIILEIRSANKSIPIYRVDINTKRLIEEKFGELFRNKPKISSINFSISPMYWIEKKIKNANECEKFYIPFKIYSEFDMYNDALRCLEEILRIAEKLNDRPWKLSALTEIGTIYFYRCSYPAALKKYEEVLKIDEESNNMYGKAIILQRIGKINYDQGDFLEALKKFEEAYNIYEKLGELSLKATVLNDIGLYYNEYGWYDQALDIFEEALEIYEMQGDLSSKAMVIHNIGLIYYNIRMFEPALERYNAALEIVEKLGDISKKAIFLLNIGVIYGEQTKYLEALNIYKEVLKINDDLGDLDGTATVLNNIALVYSKQKKYSEALHEYRKVLDICEQIRDIPSKIICLNNIASLYAKQKNYPEALKYLEETLEILKEYKLINTPNGQTIRENIEKLKNIITD